MSDATGVEAIEVHRATSLVGAVPEAGDEHAGDEHAGDEHGGALSAFRRIEVPGLGRVVELVPSPDGSQLAVTNHEDQLLIVSVAAGNARLLDESAFGRPAKTSQIKLAEVAGEQVVAVTGPEFKDSCPSFDPTGKYLYFLSRRSFDPVYDSLFFDLGFPLGSRPYLVTLRADQPSPFMARPEPEPGTPGSNGAGDAPAPGSASVWSRCQSPRPVTRPFSP